LQFHCGNPPPAADPSTLMIIEAECHFADGRRSRQRSLSPYRELYDYGGRLCQSTAAPLSHKICETEETIT
jgi:hypothetical protein